MNELYAAFFSSLAPIFVLLMMGMGIRRSGLVGDRGTDWLSRAVILFFFPVLVFHRLAATPDPNILLQDWIIHAWAVVILIGSGLIGWLVHRMSGCSAEVRLFVYMVGVPNWIYLPLALAGPIWGDNAVRLLVLFNIPTQFILWTVGVWLLHGTLRGAHALRYMLLNPGVLSAALGLLTAFGIIPIAFAEGKPGWSLTALNPLLHGIGGLTVPLSIIALGLYLGERVPLREGMFREILLLCLTRLVIAPVILIALIMGSAWAGCPMPPLVRWLLYMIAAMPVAVSAPLFARLFNRDRQLAAVGVVATTMVSLVTAPLFVLGALKLEAWIGLAAGGLTGP
jgi:predicted permease